MAYENDFTEKDRNEIIEIIRANPTKTQAAIANIVKARGFALPSGKPICDRVICAIAITAGIRRYAHGRRRKSYSRSAAVATAAPIVAIGEEKVLAQLVFESRLTKEKKLALLAQLL